MYASLKVGSRGEFVEELQRILRQKAKGAQNLKVDGMFGPNTRKAVLSFQKVQNDISSRA